jgi:uncharacterized protein YoxC
MDETEASWQKRQDQQRRLAIGSILSETAWLLSSVDGMSDELDEQTRKTNDLERCIKARDETIGNLNAECARLEKQVADLIEVQNVFYLERPGFQLRLNKKAKHAVQGNKKAR